MKKLKYYSAYIPFIGLFTPHLLEDSCIFESEKHFLLSGALQGIYYGLFLIFFFLIK